MEAKHDILEQKLCREIEILEQKYQNMAGEMSVQDVDKLDKLYHTLKSKATYDARKEAEEYEEYEGGMSGRRGCGANGRYVSRESRASDSRASYEDGYSRGYSEAMSQMDGNSGHYPMYPPMGRNPRW